MCVYVCVRKHMLSQLYALLQPASERNERKEKEEQ